jgi:alpha-beta hydrolase superfamily lysophospholipase
VLALQVQRAAEIRCAQPWARIAHTLGQLKAVRYRSDSRTIVQRTKITAPLAETLKKLGIPMPKQILSIDEPAQTADAA